MGTVKWFNATTARTCLSISPRERRRSADRTTQPRCFKSDASAVPRGLKVIDARCRGWSGRVRVASRSPRLDLGDWYRRSRDARQPIFCVYAPLTKRRAIALAWFELPGHVSASSSQWPHPLSAAKATRPSWPGRPISCPVATWSWPDVVPGGRATKPTVPSAPTAILARLEL